MTDYTKLVEALRICANTAFCNECPLDDTCYNANKLQLDAADAIEALQAEVGQWKAAVKGQEDGIKVLQTEVKRLKEAENSVERWKDMYLTKHEPKVGRWIEENRRPRSSQFVCSECHRTAYDPQPTRDKAWRKRCRYAYCPNCGAVMEDMCEVQE